MLDLSKLSDADFQALQAGKLNAMSDEGFGHLLTAQQAALTAPQRREQAAQISREQNDPTKGMSTADLMAAGAGKSVADIGTGLSQLIGLTSREDVDKQKQLDAPLMSKPAARGGYALGGMALASVPGLSLPALNTVSGATGVSAIQGMLQPVGQEDSRMANAGIGAGAGFAGALGANALSRMISPKIAPEAQTLMSEGVTLTPGQRLGGGFKRAEDAMSSMPVAGDFIRNAQRRSVVDFNASVANRALAPINDKLPSGLSGRDAVQYTEQSLGNAYESVLKRIGTVQADQQFAQEFNGLTNMIQQSPMPPEVQRQLLGALKNQVSGKLQGQGAMTAQTFKDSESELGRLARLYQGDPSVDKQLMGDALQEAQAALRRLLERQNPQYANEAKAANAGWAEFKRMQRASAMTGSEDGIFSPEAYRSSVRALDKSKDKSSFARGSALGQDLADSAVGVMGRKVPDSGTPYRTLMANPVQGAISSVLGSPLSAVYGTETGMKLMQMLMSSNRPALAKMTAKELEMMAPLLGIASSSAANASLAGK